MTKGNDKCIMKSDGAFIRSRTGRKYVLEQGRLVNMLDAV